MSFNPVRAANFHRNRGKGTRHPNDPHAGTKHSDIVRRQGLGVTVPFSSRIATPSGFAATLMATDKFVVRSEVIGAGNHQGLGRNAKHDRMLILRVGSLFVQVNEVDKGSDEPVATFHRLQEGSHFCIPRGTTHKIAASGTEDAEVLFIEEPHYQRGFEYYEQPEVRGLSPESTLTAAAPDARLGPVSTRRIDQTIAKTQAVQAAQSARRRRPGKRVGTPMPSGAQTVSGEVNVGRHAPEANSSNVVGVNPRPMGAAGFSPEE
jgi:mannose-6-phosphate isomerase-like protein (cupin superfamily)